MTSEGPLAGTWGLILGASSGFGAATARACAAAGMSIIGVHLDRKATMPLAEAVVRDVEAAGAAAHFFNVNAADEQKRAQVCERAAALVTSPPLRLVMHSLAFGTLRPFVGATPAEQVTKAQLEMTLDVMAHSLVYWTQELAGRGLIGAGTRIFAMTSAGGARVLPAYGPVSAAKAALESHVRQLALELGARGVAVNAIRAGVTDTPASRKIPGAELIFAEAARRNPGGRLTRPEDVAQTIVALCQGPSTWVSGNVIGVDGGEDVVG
ncbi:MAG TPA: SDR family oxidoreductase [Candidatus Limnocylindria bacterium]|nr:SDR family oxidoreductase [Candidatus Limnocylindria bacterium]